MDVKICITIYKVMQKCLFGSLVPLIGAIRKKMTPILFNMEFCVCLANPWWDGWGHPHFDPDNQMHVIVST